MYNSALELGIEVTHLRLHAEHAEHGPAVPITRAIKVRGAASDVSFCARQPDSNEPFSPSP